MKYFLTILLMCMTILAESKNDLIKVATDSGNFKILIRAVQEAGLSSALKSDGPLTILAPRDEAFGKLPKGTLEELLEPANKERLIRLLKFHVISGDVSAIQLLSGEVETLNGEFILS